MKIGYFEHVMPVSHLSAHHAQCVKPLNFRCKHNKTFFPKCYFTFLCNETTSKFIWGAEVDINANWKKSFLIHKFTFSTQDFCSHITNFMVTW